MPFVWATDCHSTFFFFSKQYRKTPKSYQRFSFACSTSYSKMGENLIETRKTVFDILGVVYNYTIPDNQAA
jgi:hypothetical protein